jgi:hypothetical protein
MRTTSYDCPLNTYRKPKYTARRYGGYGMPLLKPIQPQPLPLYPTLEDRNNDRFLGLESITEEDVDDFEETETYRDLANALVALRPPQPPQPLQV